MAKRWIEDCSDKVFNSLQASNFNTEISTSYQDLGGFGNTCLTLEQEDDIKFQGLDFSTLPVREFYFEHDHKGKLCTLYRHYQWTVVQIAEKFGEETLPDILKSKLVGERDTKLDVIYCLYKRKGKFKIGPKEIVAAEKRPIAACYILKDGCVELGEEVATTRCRRSSVAGRKPLAPSMALVRQPGSPHHPLSEHVDGRGEGPRKAVDPAMLVTERGLISDLDLTPGGQTVVRSLEDVKPMDMHANFQVSFQTIQDLRAAIRQIFRSDDLQLKESPAMTATEVQVRYELMQRVLVQPCPGSADVLSPLISRAFRMMFRADVLPPLRLSYRIEVRR